MAAQRRRFTLGRLILGAIVVTALAIALAANQASAASLRSEPGTGAKDAPPAPPATNTPTRTSTITPTVPTSTPTSTFTATPNCPTGYTITQSAGATMVPGATLIANSQCDDCAAPVSLPFPYTLYGQNFTGANVTSNGQMAFSTPVDSSYTNYCLPDLNSSYAIFGHWADLTTDIGLTNCSYCGIFTSVSGTAPNRIFNVEWRATSLDYGHNVNFEIRLYESQQKFDIIYAALESTGGFSAKATIGVQNNDGSKITEYQSPPSINPPCPGLTSTLAVDTKLTFDLIYFCSTSTVTPTNTPTLTRTPTVAPTITPGGSPLLVGHVTWQSRPPQPNPVQQLPITLSMRLQSGGPDLEYTGMTTDASGFFTVTAPAPGDYFWRVKSAQVGASQSLYNPGFLSTGGAVTLNGSPLTNVEMGLQQAGDCNNDDLVNSVDFIALKLSFGQAPGQAQWDARADFTGDQLVSAVDFIQMKLNYGHGGAPPIRPFGP